jgi:MFS family permease
MSTPLNDGGGAYSATETPDVSQHSVGELVGQVANDLSTLVRQEMALAKAEVKDEAKKAGKGAGMLGAAGLAGYFLLLFLSLTLMWGIGEMFDPDHPWIGALVVAVIWGIVAAVLASVGKKKLKEVNPKPEQTVESVKEDVRWTKEQMS